MKRLFTHSILCILSLLSFYPSSFAQTIKTEKQYGNKQHVLKAYLIIDPQYDKYEYQDDSTFSKTSEGGLALRPTFAYEKVRANGRFFQISLSNFSINSRDDFSEKRPLSSAPPVRGAKTFQFSVATLTEWGFPIFYEPTRKNNFLVSAAVGEFLDMWKVTPYTTASFPSEYLSMGLNLGIIPRWQYRFNQKCYLDVNIPFMIGTAALEYRYFGNPILPNFARTNTGFEWTWTPKDFMIRVGLAVRI